MGLSLGLIAIGTRKCLEYGEETQGRELYTISRYPNVEKCVEKRDKELRGVLIGDEKLPIVFNLPSQRNLYFGLEICFKIVILSLLIRIICPNHPGYVSKGFLICFYQMKCSLQGQPAGIYK